ncbi:insulin-like growth factor-binding protein complex acid labile subunit [Drosophila gunungcola]|uniref:Insulin-like growth factor-binding protein complex acid labile subunit n=1 Tax=Drosophila gunungcola TaxID=103775 RepID=A0A9Q0BUS8_9MUSC|nr:insulin-like growth factor-binding protein complex acid labile subunit [Drosophila gunungcola]XP_052836070.1 insulin-like growth factor-binding protein complex acid labile subunit [Drosophila gunungcola]XP_052836071.1 insulin-like growth factor-binding protein complex acid labile subunit [Drosophila gunungcola]XP_052836072.1 insulin-like growth factor-binding protein complex acid labile subunit [Drosophila gunungcola]XP_052836073.1 insulin-like growth factor-binding protein complex acid labi
MKHKYLILLLAGTVLLLATGVRGQHEDIPYQPVTNICQTCLCLSSQDSGHRTHFDLDCSVRSFEHILARWPEEFGSQAMAAGASSEIVASFSGNRIRLLQQLPATNASLTLSCRHCGLQELQTPLFMDVPNVEALYLSWNELSDDALVPDLFRGPFRNTRYEPIGLRDLDLSHNRIARLDRRLFEHTPHLTKLNLAYNKLAVLDEATTAAVASVATLERMDLSHNGLMSLPAGLFPKLQSLRVLDVSGNEFTVVPASLQQLANSLVQLNLAANAFSSFKENSFQGLVSLKRLNISGMPSLRIVEWGALKLSALEQLDCSRNSKLERLEMADLLGSRNLSQLDLSRNALTTLALNVSSNASSAAPWPRLRRLNIVDNPWYCSCDLFKTLELTGLAHIERETDGTEARCETPYLLAGSVLSNLTAERICKMVIPKKYREVEEEPPRFLRRRYIILTAIIASVVLVIGLVIGFVVACVRRRLKGSDYGVQPIRYTSVRGSNLSQFSQLQPASVASKFSSVHAGGSSGATTGAANA